MNVRQRVRDVAFFLTLFFSVLAVVQAQEGLCVSTACEATL
ncbi:MAG: hypothetical protein Q8O31_03680 [Rhodocyclaceae bacterium]|nr:hypothetical protein [Rhodocyclaceae bacterium]